MKKNLFYAAAIAMLVMASCQKESVNTALVPDELVTANHHANIPFHGDYITTAEFLAGPSYQRITGVGQATHMGEGNFVALANVNFGVPPPFPVTGTATFTAADGSQFMTQFVGTSTPTGPGMIRGDFVHTIIGGNGRFEGATGSLTGVSFVNQANPTNTVSYDGTINY